MEPSLCVVSSWVIKRVYIIVVWNTISGSSNLDIYFYHCLILTLIKHLKVLFNLLLLLLFIIYIVNLTVVRPRSYRIIYYLDTPTLGRRHQSFGRVTHFLLFMHASIKVGKCVFTCVKVRGEMFYAIVFILVYLGHGLNGFFFMSACLGHSANIYIFLTCIIIYTTKSFRRTCLKDLTSKSGGRKYLTYKFYLMWIRECYHARHLNVYLFVSYEVSGCKFLIILFWKEYLILLEISNHGDLNKDP